MITQHWLACRVLPMIKRIFQKYPFIISMLYSFSMFLLVFFFAYPKWESADDFLISCVLSGVTGESSPYVLVISYPMAYLLHQLQLWIPQLNWLTMAELFAVWISFSIFIWILLKKRKIGASIAAILFPLIFELSFYMTLHYTRSACLLSFAGLFLIYYSCMEVNSRLTGMAGILLALSGSLIRYGCFFLAIPFAGVPVTIHLWQQYKSEKELRPILKKNRIFFLFAAILFLLVLCGQQYNNYKYEKFSEESSYIAFNRLRAGAYDYLPDNYDEYSAEFEQIGISRNDYDMLKNNMIYDNYFNSEAYEAIATLNSNKNDTFLSKIENFRKILWPQLNYYKSGIRSGNRNIFFLFIVTAILSGIFLNRKSLFSYICILSGTMLIAFYFIWTGRFPPWIQDSLYLIGAFSFFYGIDWHTVKIPFLNKRKNGYYIEKIIVSSALSITLICSFCLGTSYFFEKAQLGKTDYTDHNINAFLLHMENEKDNVYLIDNFTYSPYPIVDVYGSIWGLKRDSWSNIIRVGGWFIEHPVYQNQLTELQLHSPIRNLTNSNVYLLTDLNSWNIQKYIIFFQEHYGLSVYPQLEEQFGIYGIYSFHINIPEGLLLTIP